MFFVSSFHDQNELPSNEQHHSTHPNDIDENLRIVHMDHGHEHNDDDTVETTTVRHKIFKKVGKNKSVILSITNISLLMSTIFTTLCHLIVI